MPRKPPVLCLAGMHRSGTSMTASWINDAGIDMVSRGVIGPDVGNELGHFEDASMAKLSARAIRRTVEDSDGWRLDRPDRRVRMTPREHVAARRLVQARDGTQAPWGWKDPRATVCLGSWRRVIGRRLRVLAVWREPVEVVASLTRRSEASSRDLLKISHDEAIVNWIAYNAAIVRFFDRHPDTTIIVELKTLLAGGAPALQTLLTDLGFETAVPALGSTFRPEMLGGDDHAVADVSCASANKDLVRSTRLQLLRRSALDLS